MLTLEVDVVEEVVVVKCGGAVDRVSGQWMNMMATTTIATPGANERRKRT